MKREEVKAIFPDATDEQLDKVMGLNGNDVNKAKSDMAELKKQLEKATTDLATANEAAKKYEDAQLQATKATNELEALKKQNEIRDIREKVSKDTGVPISMLKSETEDDCKAEAEAALAFAKSLNPTGYPTIPDGGTLGNPGTPSTAHQFAEWVRGQL